MYTQKEIQEAKKEKPKKKNKKHNGRRIFGF